MLKRGGGERGRTLNGCAYANTCTTAISEARTRLGRGRIIEFTPIDSLFSSSCGDYHNTLYFRRCARSGVVQVLLSRLATKGIGMVLYLYLISGVIIYLHICNCSIFYLIRIIIIIYIHLLFINYNYNYNIYTFIIY